MKTADAFTLMTTKDHCPKCSEELAIGRWLTFCPKYARPGDGHAMRPRPRVIDQHGGRVAGA